ncbi:hypothetical protein V0U79_03405 [Hyphobacterium sp. HN65]|uniref:Glycine zipper family protein n=1 Tax=Hyphobacterium lacteum TaxID=3116575 RepID=A0ABU7LNB7_9PROT|nr:hypothetical protein [Hyphobacterium sp. HN65]MEE2525400.1 hypothetical protein [Hyphobacterium sp. HN65]
MSDKDAKKQETEAALLKGLPFGLAIGMGIGVAIGVGTDNLPVGIGVGTALGFGFALSLGQAMISEDKKKQDKPDETPSGDGD